MIESIIDFIIDIIKGLANVITWAGTTATSAFGPWGGVAAILAIIIGLPWIVYIILKK